jgi:dihydrofolate synthase/folylpolyglutamate synthase
MYAGVLFETATPAAIVLPQAEDRPSIDTCIDGLYGLGHELAAQSVPFDIGHMRNLCDGLGSPQTKFPCVLIAGTNGKGSTCALLASMLTATGYRTGLYTSPHLLRINERIQINGKSIGDDEFAGSYNRVHRCAVQLVACGRLAQHPSFFETVTAMAFDCFAERHVDIAVLEVGLGGRLDATNVVEPLVSIVTDIGLDHENLLGNTLEQITSEKAGILRRGLPAIFLSQSSPVDETLRAEIDAKGAIMRTAQPYLSALTKNEDGCASQPCGTGDLLHAVLGGLTIELPLQGRHQLRNLALALATADELREHGYTIRSQQAIQGIVNTRWPGRFQVFPADPLLHRPEIVLDAAHNPAGAAALKAALQDRYAGRDILLVFGAMRDKAIREVADTLFPVAKQVFLTQVTNNPRAATVSELAVLTPSSAKVKGIVDPGSALACAFEEAHRLGRRSVVLVTGSIYLLGDVMRELSLDA